MSAVRHFTMVLTVAALFSSGCCLTTNCGTMGHGYSGLVYDAPSCGAACDASGDCGSYGPAVPCEDGCKVGGCLGLGCLGKIFSIAHYGCGTACGGGCGETYYHDWINDPPCSEPCDSSGQQWTGLNGDCGGCSSCATAVEPGCGVVGCTTSGCAGCEATVGCGSAGCGVADCGGCAGFQVPGRILYSSWMGVGGVLRCIRNGFLPHCSQCNAFSLSHHCTSCSTSGVGFVSDGVPVEMGTISTSSSGNCANCTTGVHPSNEVYASAGSLPHHVVTRQIKTAHGRPPHKVLSKRLR